MFGYSSILLPQLKNEDSAIKINSSEESWIGEATIITRIKRCVESKINFTLNYIFFLASIASIPMAIACILAGVIMEKYGRKPLFGLMNVLFVIGWMILCFSVNCYGLLLGRFVTGFCVGLLSPSVSVYISEITQPTYRGLFLSMQGFTVSVGILMPHALGIILEWQVVAAICALVPLTCFILISFVPESPSWLLEDGQTENAFKAFTWFRGYAPETLNEYEKLVEGQQLSMAQSNSVGLRNIRMMAVAKPFYIPFSILLLYFATLQFAGPNVIAFYTISILKNALGEYINEYTATMFVDLTRLAASVLSCIVVKNVDRRTLTTFSGLTTAATLFALSAYLYFDSMNEQLKNLYGIPMTLFMLYVMCIMIGLNPLVWILSGEMFPLRYRGTGSALVTFFNFTFLFVSVKTTPTLFLILGDHGVFLVFGICCFTGTILLTMYLPETRNKTLQEIEDSYDKPAEKLEAVFSDIEILKRDTHIG